MKKELIHTRKITVNCYETDEERLIIEGYLTDERFFPHLIHALNEKHDAGLMHHITLTMELSIPQMKIVSMKAEIPVVPDSGGRDIKKAVQKLAGLSIRPGFTNETHKILGKASRCLHLMNLILSMSSAAVQGVWSYYSQMRKGELLRPFLKQADQCSSIAVICGEKMDLLWKGYGKALLQNTKKGIEEHERIRHTTKTRISFLKKIDETFERELVDEQ